MTSLPALIEAFFTEWLMTQRRVSPATVAAYRDTFRLFLQFAATTRRRAPSSLDLADLDATLVASFLRHLETGRGNTVRTRNARLAALRSFYRFAQLRCPEHAALIARVLAIPQKRGERKLISFLENPEADALLAAPDRSTWAGRRDHALLLLAIQAGLRVSELAGLTPQRPAPRVRGTRPLPRQGPQRTRHAHDQTDRHRDQKLADRAPPRTRHAGLRQQPRNAADPQRDREDRRPPRPVSLSQLPTAGQQTNIAAHAAPHLRNAAPMGRNRHLSHRTLARARTRRNHPGLPPRRPRPKRESPPAHRTTARPARPLPARRPAPRIPRKPLTIMQTQPRPPPPPPAVLPPHSA